MASAWPKEASEMKPRGSFVAPKMVPKWLLEASGALLGAKWAPGASPGGWQNASKALWGRKKLIAISRGPSGEISQRDFTLPGGPGGRCGLHFGRPWGSFWPSFWRLVLKMRKSQILQTVHTKTLIFRVPEASRAPFLEPEIVIKSTWKPRARRSQLRDPQNRLPSALGEPPGRKKTLVTSKSAQEEFWSDFTKKETPAGVSDPVLRLTPRNSSGAARSSKGAARAQKQLGSSPGAARGEQPRSSKGAAQEQQGSSQSPETAREQPSAQRRVRSC